MRDWRDEEQDRRINELHDRQAGGDGFEDILNLFIYVVVGFVLVLAAAGMLDNWLGWGLVDWIWGLIYQWTDGAIGQPNG